MVCLYECVNDTVQFIIRALQKDQLVIVIYSTVSYVKIIHVCMVNV